MFFLERKNQRTLPTRLRNHHPESYKPKSFCFFFFRKRRVLPSCLKKPGDRPYRSGTHTSSDPGVVPRDRSGNERTRQGPPGPPSLRASAFAAAASSGWE